jgi:hypothetical protein
LDPKEKNFDILLDIRVGLGSEMKFKSGVLNFNEFPVSERIKTLSKEEIWNLAPTGQPDNGYLAPTR